MSILGPTPSYPTLLLVLDPETMPPAILLGVVLVREAAASRSMSPRSPSCSVESKGEIGSRSCEANWAVQS